MTDTDTGNAPCSFAQLCYRSMIIVVIITTWSNSFFLTRCVRICTVVSAPFAFFFLSSLCFYTPR
ncbi:hypothetical protein F4678DRAFT_121274 [Xylaria arbuscula]|nr:hypothetical protein F4678DRAFT_121274 [Xylaria arbuscula]